MTIFKALVPLSLLGKSMDSDLARFPCRYGFANAKQIYKRR